MHTSLAKHTMISIHPRYVALIQSNINSHAMWSGFWLEAVSNNECSLNWFIDWLRSIKKALLSDIWLVRIAIIIFYMVIQFMCTRTWRNHSRGKDISVLKLSVFYISHV